MRGGTLFSDLGPAGAYGGEGWTISGSTSQVTISYTVASLFTVEGTGALPVAGIDLAVSQDIPLGGQPAQSHTFYASIWTDDSGVPGTEVAGAYWSLSTSVQGLGCSGLYSNCPLVSITDITGVSLTGGQQYS